MSRGTGMSPTRRRNRRGKAGDPAELAARLPAELRRLEAYPLPSGYRALSADVAAWIDRTAPGRGAALAVPVLKAAGLSLADWYRRLLPQPTPVPPTIPQSSPPLDADYEEE